MHSIPDAVGTIVETPVGKIVYTGDFKFDESPARNLIKTDVEKIRALGKQDVLALFCESTNALKPGHSMSEKEVGDVLEEIIKNAKGRLIIASFSSQIGRIQQILDTATKYKRKIFVSGRSMRENIKIAANLGYLKGPQGMISDIRKYKKIPDNEALILTTGSQGEAISALTRMANKDHPHVKVKKGDTIVLSSSPIIGNEKAISTVVNRLAILGARVIHNEIMDVHVSGHAKQEDLKRMINLIRPRYLVPVHGEYFMRQMLGDIAHKECNIPEDHVIMIQNGDILLAERGKLEKSKETIETKYILIDGRGEGYADSQVQVDRELMSQNGALVVLIHIDKKSKKLKKTPDIVSRGFIYMNESEEIVEETTKLAGDAYRKITQKNAGASRQDIKKYIQQTLDKYTRQKLERRPLIIPLIIES
jgi:ribonuclease J